MPLEEIVSPTPEAPDAQMGSRPVAVEVRDLAKTFQIPLQRVDSIKERVLHPFATRATRELIALRGVSFDVHEGEFFGIVGPQRDRQEHAAEDPRQHLPRPTPGRSGWRAGWRRSSSSGSGFNVDLTARENVILNGVMMGLSREQAEDRVARGDRVRRARGVRRAEAQELLVGDARAAGLLGDDPVRRRHPADRRGARGRRRRLPAEVPRRLPRDARPTGRSSWSPTT